MLDQGTADEGTSSENTQEEEPPQIRIRAVHKEAQEEEEPKQSPLEEFGFDITQAAREGKLDPLVGRDDEMRFEYLMALSTAAISSSRL